MGEPVCSANSEWRCGGGSGCCCCSSILENLNECNNKREVIQFGPSDKALIHSTIELNGFLVAAAGDAQLLLLY